MHLVPYFSSPCPIRLTAAALHAGQQGSGHQPIKEGGVHLRSMALIRCQPGNRVGSCTEKDRASVVTVHALGFRQPRLPSQGTLRHHR